MKDVVRERREKMRRKDAGRVLNIKYRRKQKAVGDLSLAAFLF